MHTPLDLRGYTSVNLAFDTRYDVQPGDTGFVFLTQDGYDLYVPSGGVFIGMQSAWTTINLNLDSFIGDQWYLGYYYQTDGSGVGDGIYVDNIQVTTNTGTIFYDNGEGSHDQWFLNTFNHEYDYPVAATTTTGSGAATPFQG